MEATYNKQASQPRQPVDYETFYANQAGGEIDPYVSYVRLPQQGRGFFGRLIKGSVLPLIRSILPWVKNTALEGVGGLVSDLKEGVSLKEAGKRQLSKAANSAMDEIVAKIRQRGSGVRKTRRKRAAKKKKTTCRRKRLVLFT